MLGGEECRFMTLYLLPHHYHFFRVLAYFSPRTFIHSALIIIISFYESRSQSLLLCCSLRPPIPRFFLGVHADASLLARLLLASCSLLPPHSPLLHMQLRSGAKQIPTCPPRCAITHCLAAHPRDHVPSRRGGRGRRKGAKCEKCSRGPLRSAITPFTL